MNTTKSKGSRRKLVGFMARYNARGNRISNEYRWMMFISDVMYYEYLQV